MAMCCEKHYSIKRGGSERCEIDVVSWILSPVVRMARSTFQWNMSPTVVGVYGIRPNLTVKASIFALELLFISQSVAFTIWLSHFAGSSSRMSQLSINGLVLGKDSAYADIQGTRVILPLPSVMSLLDAI